MFEEIFGLPMHPLAVHAPVVLVPIAGLVTVVLAVKPVWRRMIGWWMVGFLVLNVVSLIVARQSGVALDNALDGVVDVSVHEQLANQTLIMALLWTAVYGALVYRDQQVAAATPTVALSADVAQQGDTVTSVLTVIVTIFAIVTTVWLIRTGHEGAYPTWRPTVDLYF